MRSDLFKDLLPGVAAPALPYCRLVDEAYQSTLDEIAPSIVHGGRYNPRDEFGVLYLSISAECAYREKIRQVHGKKTALRPQAVGFFKYVLQKCLNLTSEEVLNQLNVTRADLVRPDDYSIPQAIARQARTVGFEALYVPSAASEACANLVVFKDRLLPPAYCVCDASSVRLCP